MSETKLTKRIVDQLEPVPGKKVFAWDSELPGFGICVSQTGMTSATKSYVLQYRFAGRSRRLTLGRHGALTPEQARNIARTHLLEISRGIDPVAERHAAKEEPTLSEFAKRYMTEHSRAKKKPQSVRIDDCLLRVHIVPVLGRKKVSDITRQDVARLHHSMGKNPAQANRGLALLSHMMTLAEAWGLRTEGSNPCRHVTRYREQKRQRYLSSAELQKLGVALDHWGPAYPAAVRAIRFLLLSGMRLNEVLSLPWSAVDFERGVIHLSDSKTGKKDVVLGGPALQLLSDAPKDTKWVIPSSQEAGCHMVNINKTWAKVRETAELNDLRLHDLRHAFGSVGAQAGLSLPIVGGLLGHREVRTTQRYAHLADAPLRAGANLISGEIEAALSKREQAEVVDLHVRTGR